METWDAIRARRNVRAYTDRPLDPADVDRILEAGRRAPSASNRQKWDFVLVTDRDQLAELGTVWQGARHIPGSQATIVLVVPDPEAERYLAIDRFDLGQATMAMMITAADLGIGSGHSSVGDQDAARRILGVPDGHTCVAMLGLGYPADRPLAPLRNPDRRPFDEVVHRGQLVSRPSLTTATRRPQSSGGKPSSASTSSRSRPGRGDDVAVTGRLRLIVIGLRSTSTGPRTGWSTRSTI